jgi:acetyl-CoA carboxylase biotin carboxyl carrier protein
MSDGRRFVPELVVRAKKTESGAIELFAPRPGLWRSAPLLGAFVEAGGELGELEVLGVLHRLRVPPEVHGVVDRLPSGRRFARRPVDPSAPLCAIDPSGASATRRAEESAKAEAAAAASGPVFKTPLGGRYYARPSPASDAFVKAGDTLRGGETVALIEVMKTFNRVTYAGAPATVARVVPKDGDDVEAGDVLIELEAIDGG